MNNKELTLFKKQVKLSGLTKADFLVGIIKEVEIKSRLPDDYLKYIAWYKTWQIILTKLLGMQTQLELLIENCWKHIKELR